MSIVQKHPKRLAIIGGGSSGLITLKYALDVLSDWDITCFEKTGSITGCWGNPYPGFVSTSTKYTTQFTCYHQYDASVKLDHGNSFSEFFKEGEYGEYLEQFAAHFSLRPHVELNTTIEAIERQDKRGWRLTYSKNTGEHESKKTADFDQVILCTGLVDAPKATNYDVETLDPSQLSVPGELEKISNHRIVVIGGGESAVDYANRLANPNLKNEVYLSLKSGIRVSPRYHPIRGVPSDFLRNRLLLSLHEELRNRIGRDFVKWRIRYQENVERLFPSASKPKSEELKSKRTIRKEWAYRLTCAAKDDLFNMFHNKSDGFLHAVADRRISIIGPAENGTLKRFHTFDCDEWVDVAPDLVVPAIGYQPAFGVLFKNVKLKDFYLGCLHIHYPDLHLVGFARPIIGNIPTISEMQARYVCNAIAGKIDRSVDIETRHDRDITKRKKRYGKINTDAVYPVEMFPYCDQLARQMGCYPSRQSAESFKNWARQQLSPASTLHYIKGPHRAPVYMPNLLMFLLWLLVPVSLIYRLKKTGLYDDH